MRMILNMRMIRLGDEMMNMRMVLYNSLSNVRGRMPWSSMVRKYGSIKMANMVSMVGTRYGEENLGQVRNCQTDFSGQLSTCGQA